MSKTPCKIVIHNEVYCDVLGIHGNHLDFFYKKYAVPAPNYFFNPRYKLGVWDGKIRYFQESGRTYLYLLEEILPILISFGYAPKIDDRRQATPFIPEPITDQIFAHIMHADTGEPIVLRDYQVRSANALIDNSYGIINACTGAGKTLLTAAVCQAYGAGGLRTLVIVPSQDLIRQTKADFITVQMDVGEYSGASKDVNHQHIISTWQALKNNPMLLQTFDLVLVDEVHLAKGKVLQDILTKHAGKIPFRFGLTGTMPKDPADNLTIQVALGPVRDRIEASELMERGILSQVDIEVLQLEEDLRKEYEQYVAEEPADKPATYIQFKDAYFGDFSAEKSYIHRRQERVEFIADLILNKQEQEGGNVMVFVDSVSLGRRIAECIPNAILVNGTDTKKVKERTAVYEMFKERDDLIVVATVHIAGTGLNVRRINHLFLVDLGKSFTRIIQTIGRGARTAHDKNTFTVTDISSDLKYGKRHLATRLTYYKEANYPYKKKKIDYSRVMEYR